MEVPAEIRITVDGAQFYTFVRGLKRGFRSSEIGTVVLSLRDNQLTVETERGGCVLSCQSSVELTARMKA